MLKTFRFWLLMLLMVFVLSSMTWAANEKLFDLNFKNTDLKDLLNSLAASGGVHFVYEEQENEITGIVTIHLSKVTFGEALSIIAKSNNLVYTKEKDNRVYHISQLDTAVLKVDFDQGALSVLANNARVAKLFELISQKSGVSYVVDPELKKERISIFFEKAPLQDGVKTILMQANFDIQPVGNISYIRRGQSKLQFKVEYQNDVLTVDAKDIPLTVLAKDITEKSGSTIIPDQNANPSVTTFFKNLSIAEGLQVICDTYNLQLNKEGSVWRITRKSNNARVRYQDKLLTVDVDGVDVAEITNEISRVTGVNISLARDVRGMISVHIKNMPLEKAFSSIYEPQGWSVERLSKNYRVSVNTNQTQNIHVNYNSETQLFDLEVQYAQLTPVLSELARKADLNMVVMSSVNWSLSNIRLRDQNIDQILNYLLKGTVFTYRFIDDTYVIGDGMFPRPETSDFSAVKVYPIRYIKADQLLNSLPPIFPRQNFVIIQDKNSIIVTAPLNIHTLFSKYLDQVDIDAVENKTEVIRIKYMKAEDVMKYIPASIPKNDVVVVKEMNAITVTGPVNLVNQVKQYLEKIDQPNPMIVFDVLVVKVDNNNSLDLGLKATLPTGPGSSLTFNMIEGKLSPGNATLGMLDSINMMIRNGKGKVLQNPTITTLNGYPATFSVTSSHTTKVLASTITNADGTKNDTFTPKTSDSGLAITITPWVSVNDIITMEIKPTINEYSASDDPTLPDTAKNETNTTIRVKNKETIIISGIRSNRKEKTINKVPILGDIPLLGLLFRNTSTKDIQQEFVIIITPTLVYDELSKQDANTRINNKYSDKILNEIQNQKDRGTNKNSDSKNSDKKDDKTENTNNSNQTDAIDNKKDNVDGSKETDSNK